MSNDLLGHPTYGSSWEGFVIENTLSALPEWKPHFYGSATGDEIDLLLEKGRQRVAIEIKASTSPEVTSGFWRALDDLKVDRAVVVAPVDSPYPYKGNIQVIPPQFVRRHLESLQIVHSKYPRPIKSYKAVFAPQNVKIAPISRVGLNAYVLISYN